MCMCDVKVTPSVVQLVSEMYVLVLMCVCVSLCECVCVCVSLLVYAVDLQALPEALEEKHCFLPLIFRESTEKTFLIDL